MRNLLPQKDLDRLPFDYVDPYYQTFKNPDGDYNVYFAYWGPFCIWSTDTPDGNWHIDQPVDTDIEFSHFLQVYPRLEHLSDTNIENWNFTSTYQGKDIRWSRSKKQWTYLNYKPVNFIESEEAEVALTLDTAQQAIKRSIHRLSPSSRALPGSLPDTLTPAPVPTYPLSRPMSRKGKAHASSLFCAPTPLAGPSLTQPTAPRTPPCGPSPPPPRSLLRTRQPSLPRQPLPAPSPSPPPPPVMAAQQGASAARVMGTPPEPFDGTTSKADAFWTSLENYFFLNATAFPDEQTRITTSLTYFHMGTPAGEWAKDRQKIALSAHPIYFSTWPEFETAFCAHFIPADSEIGRASCRERV